MVSFTPRQLYSQGKSPWYPTDRRLGGAQTRWRREKLPAPAGTRAPDHPARSLALGSAEVENAGSYTYTPPYVFTLIKFGNI
jgi:hypothetical protein